MKMAGKYTVRPMDPMGLDVSYGIGCFIITQLAIYKGTYHLLREFETAIECWNMLLNPTSNDRQYPGWHQSSYSQMMIKGCSITFQNVYIVFRFR